MYLLNKASSMVGVSTLSIVLLLVNLKLLVTKTRSATDMATFPVNIPPLLGIQGVRAVEVIHVLEPLYRASSIAWFITLVVVLAL